MQDAFKDAYEDTYEDAYEDALEDEAPREAQSALRRVKQKQERIKKPSIDICRITAAAFRINLKRKENVFFTTSLLEIDRELRDREDLEYIPRE